ncbi:hypothetical protein BR93DRAFT_566820 [Coniochaeta sp. PMI_546]|nr:hypothetical protein BR93DRAFT_566820 [Coniochaeta sp. PMI_546]
MTLKRDCCFFNSGVWISFYRMRCKSWARMRIAEYRAGVLVWLLFLPCQTLATLDTFSLVELGYSTYGVRATLGQAEDIG